MRKAYAFLRRGVVYLHAMSRTTNGSLGFGGRRSSKSLGMAKTQAAS